MQDVGFSIEDDGQMVVGVLLERADREVGISRREREEEIRVGLFLRRHRLCIETRDRRRKEHRRIARLAGDGKVVDNKFIERLLDDLTRVERRTGHERSESERAFHTGASLYLKSCTTSGSRPLPSRSGLRIKRNSIEAVKANKTLPKRIQTEEGVFVQDQAAAACPSANTRRPRASRDE
jgi:hypothetical protein